MAEEDLLQKMEQLQRAYDHLRDQKDLKDQAIAKANRAAEAEVARRTKEAEAARRAEEAEDESDWGFDDPIASETITFRGPTGPRNTAPNFFAAEPTFNYTENLNLNRQNLPKPEEGNSQVNTPIQSGDESSNSECDFD